MTRKEYDVVIYKIKTLIKKDKFVFYDGYTIDVDRDDFCEDDIPEKFDLAVANFGTMSYEDPAIHKLSMAEFEDKFEKRIPVF